MPALSALLCCDSREGPAAGAFLPALASLLPCWEKCLHPQQRGSSDSRHCNLGADGTLPAALRTVELPAAFSDVQPAYLPKIVVLWAPAVFLLHASNPLSIMLGSHVRTSLSPGFASAEWSHCSALPGLL